MSDVIINIIIIILLIKITLLVLFLLFWKFYFLRNPGREIPKGNNLVSPADGKIIHVFESHKKHIKIKKHFGIINTLAKEVAKDCSMISIFMSPFDVHYNRAPLDGRVISVKHSKGKFLNAKNLALENEKNEILLKTKIGNVKVIQIAGLIARRIECFVKKGDIVKKGQRIGLINLGSQVIVILPKRKVKIVVNEKKKLKGGVSIIAKIK